MQRQGDENDKILTICGNPTVEEALITKTGLEMTL